MQCFWWFHTYGGLVSFLLKCCPEGLLLLLSSPAPKKSVILTKFSVFRQFHLVFQIVFSLKILEIKKTIDQQFGQKIRIFPKSWRSKLFSLFWKKFRVEIFLLVLSPNHRKYIKRHLIKSPVGSWISNTGLIWIPSKSALWFSDDFYSLWEVCPFKFD